MKAEGVREIAEKAETEPQARYLFDKFGKNLGSFLSPWLVKFGAEILVMGGNISNAYRLFGTAFEKELAVSGCTARVAISDLKEDAAMLGSAYLLEESFWKAVQPVLSHM
jgi:glucokinase